MSIVKRGNSKYWYIQFQLRGKTYIKSSRTTNRKAAEQMEVEWKAKIHSQEFLGHREQITIRAAIEEYCASKQGTPNHRNLVGTANITLKLLQANKPLDELTSHELERYKRDRLQQGVKPQTIKHGLGLIRSAWKLAKKLGYQVGELEFPTIKMPRSPLRYLSEEEERRLLAELDIRREAQGLRPFDERPADMLQAMQDVYDLVILLLDTGARYSEIANIPWASIDLNQRAIRLWRPKVQNEGILFMTDRAYDVLARRAVTVPGQFVFQNKDGGARGYATASIRKAFVRAGLADCKIHTLRHTHASRLIQNGMSVYEVREVLGHTDIKTTMRYAHLESRQVTSKARDVINRLNKAANDKDI